MARQYEVKRYKISVRVLSQEGTCARKHKVGDQWVVDSETPGGLCLAAFGALFPNLRLLRYGGTLPGGVDPDVSTVSCPDTANPVVFELRRLRE